MSDLTHLAQKSVDELVEMKGDLAYQAQMAALESLPTAAIEGEWRAVVDELSRRGIETQPGAR